MPRQAALLPVMIRRPFPRAEKAPFAAFPRFASGVAFFQEGEA